MPGTGTDRAARRLPPAAAALAGGAALLALGLALARARLPEWRLGELPDRQVLAREYSAVAARCGLRLVGDRPRLAVVEASQRRRLSKEMALTSAVPSAMVAIRAQQKAVSARPDAAGGAETLTVWFDAAGKPQAADWRPSGLAGVAGMVRNAAPPRAVRPEAAAAALLAQGESLGPPVRWFVAGFPVDFYPIAGSVPPQHVTAAAVSVFVEASRNPGGAPRVLSGRDLLDPLVGSSAIARRQGTLTAIAIAFCVLAIRRRIGLANATWLAALAGAAVLPGALGQPSAETMAVAVASLAFASAWLGVLWAAAESLWRTGDPRFDATLDLLRAGRLTHRAGRALLCGTGLGAAAAGLGLAAYALAARLPGAQTDALSVDLPLLDGWDGPLAVAIAIAAIVACLLAWGRRLSRRRWVPYAAAVVAALACSPIQLRPLPLALAGGVAVAGTLVAAAELGGLAALLAAALAYRLLPAAAFAALHLSWMAGGFALAAGAMAVLIAAGAAGARRGQEEEAEAEARPPAFILRLERERRLGVEMELLARMQLGLLPGRLPLLPGWEVAARSLLADRAGGDLYDFVRDGAGRWWIAAGDVAGHGYSCAIAQAMVKAALASLLGAARSPAEILAETDRVLRTAAAARTFTSLALLRLDPATGEALFANAGHPYPLLAEPGRAVREVELPGLPLGQGPPRRYADLPLALAPGASLALCSDGFFEAVAAGRRGGAQYGYERPRVVLEQLAGRPAAEVLDGLLEDWRRHRGPGAPEDDTTIVVLRRLPAASDDLSTNASSEDH
jgi:serine phosphatase RsbU (regulator of sigma subunit)